MRGRIVVSTVRQLPINPLGARPWLIRKRPIGWIDDHAACAGCQEIFCVAFEPVVRPSTIRLVITCQIRFPVGRPAQIVPVLTAGRAPLGGISAGFPNGEGGEPGLGYQVRGSRSNAPLSSSASA